MMKLTKAQEKRFDEEIYEELLEYSYKAFIILVKQHLADELALAKKEVVEEVKKEFCFTEPKPTHVNDKEISEKSPLMKYLRGRDSVREQLKVSLDSLLIKLNEQN